MYANAERLLQLAFMMQAARPGISLGDIQSEFGIGRRTAERLRDAVLRVFPQAGEVPSDDALKRWRIPAGVITASLPLRPMKSRSSIWRRRACVAKDWMLVPERSRSFVES